jgi:hypothetical protein
LSDTLTVGIIAGVSAFGGSMVAGGFLIAGQLLASNSQAKVSREASAAQAEMAREAAKAQADLAREAWERSQRAQAHSQLEAACMEVIRYIQQIGTAVQNWETGSMQATQALPLINSAASAVLESGYGILLRRGPNDATGPLIGRVVNQASEFSGLYLPSRNPPATVLEKKAQVAVVGAAITVLFQHMHQMLRADEKGN